jgi:hypothetical protein
VGFGGYVGEVVQWLIGAQPSKFPKGSSKNEKFIRFRDKGVHMWLVQYLLNGNYGSLKDAFGHLEECINSRNTTYHFPTREDLVAAMAICQRHVRDHRDHFRTLLPLECFVLDDFSYLDRIYLAPSTS